MFIVLAIEVMGGYGCTQDEAVNNLASPWEEDFYSDWSKTDDPALCAREDIDQYVPEPCWALWSW